MVNVFVCRHPREAVWSFPLLENRLLLIGLGVEIALLLLIVFSSAGNWLFGTQAFAPAIWGIIAFLALVFGALEELRKRFVRHDARRTESASSPPPD